jgi:hypothetical protein
MPGVNAELIPHEQQKLKNKLEAAKLGQPIKDVIEEPAAASSANGMRLDEAMANFACPEAVGVVLCLSREQCDGEHCAGNTSG